MQRMEGESFENFRARRAAVNKTEKKYLRGMTFWSSKMPVKGKDGKIEKVVGLTYRKPKNEPQRVS